MNIGRHNTTSEMLIESLDELLFAVETCISYRKIDPNLWPRPHGKGGILGFPATTLMFTIVDTIGSYCDDMMVQIDGKLKPIKPGSVLSHFYILNSNYFRLNLSYIDIKQIYNFARNTLSHNSLIGKEILLHPGKSNEFIKVNSYSGKGRYIIYVSSFYESCLKAVTLFKEDMDDIVPYSINGKDFKS